MATANNNETNERLTGNNNELFTKIREMKTYLLLYLFIALEWIKGPLKTKESRHTTFIGLS